MMLFIKRCHNVKERRRPVTAMTLMERPTQARSTQLMMALGYYRPLEKFKVI